MIRIGTCLWTIFAILMVVSCVEEQDFNQYEDISVTPTYEAGLFYLEVPERSVNQLTGTNVYSRDFDFGAFSEDIFSKRVMEGVLTYEVGNTTSKPLEVEVRFLDGDGAVLDAEQFTLGPEPTAVLTKETHYGPYNGDINIIRNTSSLFVVVTNLGDTSSTSTQENPVFTLKSSAKFKVHIKQ
ncbi:MAG: hypothetical protein CR994_03695 [Maribacter sp.]|nr:MAG: hypothetical protein CR994_03695 [Maribacter sp.]